jgi:RNA polymerase sigma-70 factor (ECF subfamily)
VTTRLVRPPDAQTLACPCRHGDVPAEMAGQRPLLERAAAGDREAFARLYDDQVEGVFRYLLAWTGDRSAARDMTAQVFKGAMAWLPVTAGGEGEAGAWLVAMAHDAVLQARGSGWIPGPGDGQAAPRDVVGAVALLGDPEREVVVLRLLLGHSLAHTAHLSGYSQRAVTELQLAACLTISDLTSRVAPGGPGAAGPAEAPPAADEFERRLGRWEVDLTGGDARLADPLAVAASLRGSSLRGLVSRPPTPPAPGATTPPPTRPATTTPQTTRPRPTTTRAATTTATTTTSPATTTTTPTTTT